MDSNGVHSIMKKYVAYDKDTFKFIGFYDEGRADTPDTVDEVDSTTFLEDIGQDTHYNPETKTFYTPEADLLEREEEHNRSWRDYNLQSSDKYMLSDFRLTGKERAEMIQFRNDLRDYPITGVRPISPACFKEGY